ncbi:MAG: sigma factor-like helix-turn-helix DNA-binding protein, partial [Bacteroides uniformis]
KNELLAEALNALPERKRDIILLSYFLDMSDAEIGELLNVVRTTVFRQTGVPPLLSLAPPQGCRP